MAKFEYNYVLTAAVVSWFSAQVIKTIINLLKTKKFNAERLIGSGGMPSSHSSLVCSAGVAMFRTCGGGSPEFALMFIVAMIVMYDAMGVRRAAGLHAHELNRMNKIFDIKGINNRDESKSEDKKKKQKELKEYLGHTPFEVLGGAILGFAVAFIVPTGV
ncbi:MAG: divergent PAP2 family protein [Oscillospiraceae bacterium]|nr:divergent PAP2 family protein [Oscillospiraceae bacterium]